MQDATDALDFEPAAVYRDRIKALTRIQNRQGINLDGIGDADVLALARRGQTCIQVFFLRADRTTATEPIFRAMPGQSDADVLEAFLGQFYERPAAPDLMLSSQHAATRRWWPMRCAARGRRSR